MWGKIMLDAFYKIFLNILFDKLVLQTNVPQTNLTYVSGKGFGVKMYFGKLKSNSERISNSTIKVFYKMHTHKYHKGVVYA